jgi:hypothetical protein
MELLLNLAWLLLAIPAYWLWRGRVASRKFSSLQCLFALGCLLVILFPVVSATDDLRVMRAEMEESPVSKRTLRQANHEKSSSSKWQSQPAIAGSAALFLTWAESSQRLSSPRLVPPVAPTVQRIGRAPPLSFLG